LLHLALRGARGEFRDVLLTDAPGEWFTRWSVQEDATDAEGARWTVRHADAFLVIADCQRLSGPERGQARSDTCQLLERLGNHVEDRPTLLVWAKSDHKPQEPIRDAIRNTLAQRIPGATEVETTTKAPESLALALEKLLALAWTPANARPVAVPILSHDPYASYRGSYGYA
jgi:hypothetical protein